MGRWSSLHEDFARVKTPMGIQRFEVAKFFPTNEDSIQKKAKALTYIKNYFDTIE